MKHKILTCLCIAFHPQVFAETNKPLVLVNDTYPPYVLDGKDKNKPGIDIEIAIEAMKRAGYTVEVKLMPWNRVLKTLEDGDADFTTTLDFKPERDAYLDWSVPYRKGTIYHFYVKKGSNIKAKKLEDLKGKTMGTTAGFSYPATILETIGGKREDGQNLAKTIEKLVMGRSDFIIVNSIAGSYELKQGGFMDKVDKLEVEFTNEGNGVFMGFSKKRKLGAVIEKFNKAMTEMEKDGTITKIEQKYTQ